MPDEARFALLVERHKDRAYAAAYRILANRDEALDVLQESLLALYQRLGAVDDEWAGPWLVRVASNRAIDRWRKSRRESIAPVLPLRAAESPVDDELRSQVLAALDRLSPKQREVVLLRIFEELRFSAIAANLNISEGAVKTHFRRGLAALRDILSPLDQEALHR